MDYRIIKNELGYYEVENKPDEAFLTEYYATKYYNSKENKLNQYQNSYTSGELLFKKNRATRKEQSIQSIRPNWDLGQKRLLDIGSGEGWNLDYFHKLGSTVVGVEYQSMACEALNPSVAKNVLAGNVWRIIEEISDKGETFDIIIMDNVLEHVPNPKDVLKLVKKVLSKDGLLIIEVPNDYSILHEELKNGDCISRDFWLAPPDHLSYFSSNSLNNLMNFSSFENEKMSCDFPIDLNLFNTDTNYVEDKTKGKNVHFSRVKIENLFDSISVKKTNEMYDILASMGLGRNIIGYYSHENE